MFKYIYDIVMETSLGDKKGEMILIINNSEIHGFLYILGEENLFTGETRKKGKCILRGSITTIVGKFEYTANGFFDDKKIRLTLYGRHSSYNIIGKIQKTMEGD